MVIYSALFWSCYTRGGTAIKWWNSDQVVEQRSSGGTAIKWWNTEAPVASKKEIEEARKAALARGIDADLVKLLGTKVGGEMVTSAGARCRVGDDTMTAMELRELASG